MKREEQLMSIHLLHFRWFRYKFESLSCLHPGYLSKRIHAHAHFYRTEKAVKTAMTVWKACKSQVCSCCSLSIRMIDLINSHLALNVSRCLRMHPKIVYIMSRFYLCLLYICCELEVRQQLPNCLTKCDTQHSFSHIKVCFPFKRWSNRNEIYCKHTQNGKNNEQSEKFNVTFIRYGNMHHVNKKNASFC